MIEISPLANHPHLIPALADGFFAEWPEWCARAGRPVVESIFEPGPRGALPVILVAHEGGAALGTVALRPYFGDEPMEHTPWVRQFFVLPRYRGRGIDRALGQAVEEEARRLGFASLFAATNRIERLLVRRGWVAFEVVDHDGQPMSWMRKPILR